MGLDIGQFFEALDGRAGRIPLDELSRLLGALTADLDCFRSHVVFGEDAYRRNLYRTGAAYQALVLCWRPGQASPIHDHLGSSCGVRVLAGVATEVGYRRTPAGPLEVVRRRQIPAGAICATEDEDIHEMANFQEDGSHLVTLHIYSPPLRIMRNFSLDGRLTEVWHEPTYAAHGPALGG